ncbi:hypothetical protein [Paenibacillus paeoniae]|nr:hypothetical protein [Paenibacillus paeoniae]
MLKLLHESTPSEFIGEYVYAIGIYYIFNENNDYSISHIAMYRIRFRH